MDGQNKPLFVYDGDCGFCRYWMERWRQRYGADVDFVPYQSAQDQFPDITTEEFQQSAWFIKPSERHRAAAAVFAMQSTWKWRWYRRIPLFRSLSEFAYRWIADHRQLASRVTKLLWGKEPLYSRYIFSRWIFLRLLGVVFLIAFTSALPQIVGLVGDQGLLPVRELYQTMEAQPTFQPYHTTPSIPTTTETVLRLIPLMGIGASLLLILDVLALPGLIMVWILYFTLIGIGQNFFTFQWDLLLLEVGFFALFITPLTWIGSRRKQAEPSRTRIGLLRWILVKLIFLSGFLKLFAGNDVWRDLTAVSYHFETQPLPTVLGWWMHQLPLWADKVATLGTFVIQLLAPLLIFMPRRLRLIGAGSIVFLEILIGLTGNYTFFNLLTIILVILLLDDQWFTKTLKIPVKEYWYPVKAFTANIWHKLVTGMLVIMVTVGSIGLAANITRNQKPIWRPFQTAAIQMSRLGIFNRYGLFISMTTVRREIVLEGSYDGTRWQAYDFNHKPGQLDKAPTWVAPHQPRLDWQMWFAALGTIEQNPWLLRLAERLLMNESDITGLLAHNPFTGGPPTFIRALVYEYQFTTHSERKQGGNWWKRGEPQMYFPPVQLLPEN